MRSRTVSYEYQKSYKESLRILKSIRRKREVALEKYDEYHSTLKDNTIKIFMHLTELYTFSMIKLDKTRSLLEELRSRNNYDHKNWLSEMRFDHHKEIKHIEHELNGIEDIASNVLYILDPIADLWNEYWERRGIKPEEPDQFYEWIIGKSSVNQLREFLERAYRYYDRVLESNIKNKRFLRKILKGSFSSEEKKMIKERIRIYEEGIEEKEILKEVVHHALRSIDGLTKLVKEVTGKRPKKVSDLFISKRVIDEYYSSLYRKTLRTLAKEHLQQVDHAEVRLPPEEAFGLLGIKVEDLSDYQRTLIEERRLTEDGLNEILQSIAEKKMSQYTPVDKIHLVTEGNEHFPPKIYLPKESKVSELLKYILKDDLNVFILLQYGFESIGDKLTEYTEPIRTGVFATWVYLRSKYPKSRLLLFSEMIEDLANNEYYEDNGNYYVIDVERLWDNIKRRYRKELADREKRRNYLKERLRVKMNLAASLVVYEKFTESDCGKDNEYLEELITGYQEMLLDNIYNVPETAGENIFNILERKKKRLYNGEKNGNDVDEYVTEDPINDRFKVDDDTREYLEKCKISHEVVEYVITYGVRRKEGDLATNDSYIPRELVYKNTKRALKRDGKDDLIPKIKETISFLVRKGILFEHKNGNTLSINYKDSPDEELVYLQERIKQYIYLIRNCR